MLASFIQIQGREDTFTIHESKLVERFSRLRTLKRGYVSIMQDERNNVFGKPFVHSSKFRLKRGLNSAKSILFTVAEADGLRKFGVIRLPDSPHNVS